MKSTAKVPVPSARWERVTKDEWSVTMRMQVPGGWLYRYTEWCDTNNGPFLTTGLTFVPDQSPETG